MFSSESSVCLAVPQLEQAGPVQAKHRFQSQDPRWRPHEKLPWRLLLTIRVHVSSHHRVVLAQHIPSGVFLEWTLAWSKGTKINSKYFYKFFKNTHKFVISSRRVVFMLNFTVILRGRSPLSSFLYRRVRARVVGWLLNMCAGKLA